MGGGVGEISGGPDGTSGCRRHKKRVEKFGTRNNALFFVAIEAVVGLKQGRRFKTPATRFLCLRHPDLWSGPPIPSMQVHPTLLLQFALIDLTNQCFVSLNHAGERTLG